MPHFYVPLENISENTFRITGEDVHYLVTVRRYSKGDKLKLFDGKGGTMIGVIDTVSKDEIKGTFIKTETNGTAAATINLYHAVPKGERFGWLIEKAAELGVAKIIPLITERSVIREASEPKFDRWERLAKAACQQCGRPGLMKIEKPVELKEAISCVAAQNMPSTYNIIPWEAENTKTLREVFQGAEKAITANIFIGPEGGFSVKEIELAKSSVLSLLRWAQEYSGLKQPACCR